MVTNTDLEKRFFDLIAQSIELVNRGKRNSAEINSLNAQLQRFKERTITTELYESSFNHHHRP
jgi:hypothetical protein